MLIRIIIEVNDEEIYTNIYDINKEQLRILIKTRTTLQNGLKIITNLIHNPNFKETIKKYNKVYEIDEIIIDDDKSLKHYDGNIRIQYKTNKQCFLCEYYQSHFYTLNKFICKYKKKELTTTSICENYTQISNKKIIIKLITSTIIILLTLLLIYNIYLLI